MVRTYREAGVDINKESLAIKGLVSELRDTFLHRKDKVGEVLSDIGHFSGVIKLSQSKGLAISTDGVGTKILVAHAMNKYDTLGIDLVAMNTNDIICIGAEPLAMVDYLAMENPDPRITREIGKGLNKGSKEAMISIVGGELATLPEIVNGLDLTGTIVGIVNLDNIITGEEVRVGDVIIGLESSGIHSNGLTLARKVLLEKYNIKDKIFGSKSVGEELLVPTKIYVKEVLDILKEVKVHGLANITGGGLGNLTRLTQYGFLIDYLPAPQKIFQFIQKTGNIAEKEMYRTFNMGIGFCVIAKESEANKIIDICKKHRTKAFEIGRVVKGEGVKIKGKDFALKY